MPQQGSFFGPSWNDQEIKSFLDTEQIKYKKFENLKIETSTSRQIWITVE